MVEMFTATSATPPSTVLVIDDDEVAVEQFGRMLRGEGYLVRTALDAETGLAEIKTHRPSAILLDLRMPLVDGLGFLQRLRAVDTGIPVTIVTGDYFIDDETATTLRSLGAEIQFKPLWLEDLSMVVHAMLDGPPVSSGLAATT